MHELLCTRVHRAAAPDVIDDRSYKRVVRLTILYSCRFIGSRDYRKAVKWLFGDNKDIQNGLMDLKDDLDHSVYRNDLYRSAHHLSTQDECSLDVLKAVSKWSKVEVEDLLSLKKFLNQAEKATLRELAEAPGRYSERQIAALIKHVDPIIRNIVYRQLAFVFNHDPMMEGAEDLIEQLRTQAVKVIREYEVRNITDDHMIKNVVVGVQNHSVNIAESFGRDKRRPLMRVSKKDAYREVWYLNIKDFTICQVKVSPNPKLRVKRGDSLYVLVQDCETESLFLVHCKRLYETHNEAEEAAGLRRDGKYSKRQCYVDLSPQSFDEFQQTCVSIDTAADEEGVPLVHKLPDECASTDAETDDADEGQQLVNELTPKLREFAEIVLSPENHEFFSDWASRAETAISSSELKRLGKAACDYLGLTKPRIKTELKNTPARIWSKGARSLITS